MPLQASTPAIHTQGSLRGWRFALIGEPDGLANQDIAPTGFTVEKINFNEKFYNEFNLLKHI